MLQRNLQVARVGADLKNRLGALTDVSGNVVQSYQYDPYGNVTSATGSITTNPWQFAGGFYDSTTGLYKFGVRYYDPALGRWTQQDPLGGSLFDPSTGNRYAYANDDPTNLTDRTGALSCGVATFLGIATVTIAIGALFVASDGAIAAGLAAESGDVAAGFAASAANNAVAVTGISGLIAGATSIFSQGDSCP